MPRYKRTFDEAELDLPADAEIPPEDKETLRTLRNMWEFASLMQYIFLFGHVVKIDDDFDIEDLETECLKSSPSEKLASIGLQFLKYVSSHRGLTSEIFDEYTRRQYLAKAPQRNPFGDEEEPIKFNDLDIFTRIKVLQQLSTWTLGNADRIRNMMPEDEDHLNWRMEPLGWDRDDRAYFVLDDNRLYRRADEPLPPPTPKPKPKSKVKNKASQGGKSRGTRASKRRKIEESDEEEPEEQTEADDTIANGDAMTNGNHASQEEEPGYGFTSKTWECVAITLEEYQEFMASIFRSRDPDEKQLRSRIESEVLPIIEKRAEALRQKQLKKLRELENVQKMATAKRSSRLASKAEKEESERQEREAEAKRQADLKMAREEQDRQRRIEEGHESRRLTREQRVKEREAKRILHEEELARLEADGERAESQGFDGDAAEAKRISERQRKSQKEQHQKELERLAEDEGNWYFDCAVCGKHGENMDDGTHSIACDKCNVWQHSKCHGFSPKQAEGSSFTFICATCKRKEEDAKKPKIPPLKLHNRTSGSPETQKNASRPVTANGQQAGRLPDHVSKQLDGLHNHDPRHPGPSPGPFGQITNGPGFAPNGQMQGYRYPPVGNFAPHQPYQTMNRNVQPPPGHPHNGPATSPQPTMYSPPHHQQQHLYAHQHAVAASGGHPGYHPQVNQAAAPSGPSPRAHSGAFPANPPAQQQFAYPPQPQYGQWNQQTTQHNAQQKRASDHLMNGFQSPVKASREPASPSPYQHQGQIHETPNRYSQQPKQQLPQPLQRSPKTDLPPPAQLYQPHAASSPVKSSPPASHQLPPIRASPYPLQRTPQGLAPSVNGVHGPQSTHQPREVQTPQMPRFSNGNGSSHADHVAADGMSGPWPEGSQAIPKKHDQSPAPPSSAHSIAERKVFPPNTPLVPSPGQQAAGATGSIPVKKMPDSDMGQILPRPATDSYSPPAPATTTQMPSQQ